MNDTVRISHYDFKIERIKGKTMSANEVFGLCNKDKQIIYIDSSATPAVQRDTLLHEILHAIWWTGYLEDDDKEERVISTLATGLMNVYRDNPWLMEELK